MDYSKYRDGDKMVYLNYRVPVPSQMSYSEDYTKSMLLSGLENEVATKAEYQGFALDHDSVVIEKTGESAHDDYLMNVEVYRAKGVAIKLSREPLVMRLIDMKAFNTGSTFRDRNGRLWLNNAYGGYSIRWTDNFEDAHNRQYNLMYEMPLRLLWEPSEPMDDAQIRTARYDDHTGIPERVMVEMNSGLQPALMEGAL